MKIKLPNGRELEFKVKISDPKSKVIESIKDVMKKDKKTKLYGDLLIAIIANPMFNIVEAKKTTKEKG